jgi:predicted aminopeptidase
MVRMLTETPAASVAMPAAEAVRARPLKLMSALVLAFALAPMRALTLSLACALLAGCGTTYLVQAAGGEYHVLHEREPIDKVLADPNTSPQLHEHLTQVRAARQFASQELGLPDNDSYKSYADIHRRFVVWNVVATPRFSITPIRWCFPVAGCVAYRGYFHEQDARNHALELESKGYDVAVDGVPAFSTLGRFADPVLSSMLPYGDDELAATIFHELAHQLIYVPGDSRFNEAFATTVEDAGLERWLAHQGDSKRIKAYRDAEAHEAAFVSLFEHTRGQLAQLYASGVPEPQMAIEKASLFTALTGDIHALERRQGATYPLYEEWLAEGMNNARLASVATYYDCVPGFKRLLEEEDNDLPRFYAAVRRLAELPQAERHARLCTKAGTKEIPAAARGTAAPPRASTAGGCRVACSHRSGTRCRVSASESYPG